MIRQVHLSPKTSSVKLIGHVDLLFMFFMRYKEYIMRLKYASKYFKKYLHVKSKNVIINLQYASEN